MKYRVQNTRILTSDEMLSILHKSAKMYSEYADAKELIVHKKRCQCDVFKLEVVIQEELKALEEMLK